MHFNYQQFIIIFFRTNYEMEKGFLFWIEYFVCYFRNLVWREFYSKNKILNYISKRFNRSICEFFELLLKHSLESRNIKNDENRRYFNGNNKEGSWKVESTKTILIQPQLTYRPSKSIWRGCISKAGSPLQISEITRRFNDLLFCPINLVQLISVHLN